jgi:hypothetical protein
MKICGGDEILLYSVLTSVTMDESDQLHAPIQFTLVSTCTPWTGG